MGFTPSEGEMLEVASAWKAAESAAGRKPDGKARARLASELTEPVAQRILYPYEGSRHLRSDGVYPGCWPNEAHTTTNVLCAIMQACPVDVTTTTIFGDNSSQDKFL